MNEPVRRPGFHALLIGIDLYLPNRIGPGTYPSLGGCVRDVRLVGAFLRERLGLAPERIHQLTATDDGHGQLVEAPDHQATYANMVRAFQDLASRTAPGDAVYVHYSGHGARATTLFPALKPAGLDEALVPTDIGNSATQYLRDVELHRLLQAIVDRGARLTVVLDCCHAGSATRGVDVAVRGIGIVDTTPRPVPPLTPMGELTSAWDREPRLSARSLAAGTWWLLEPKGYVLFAACRESEQAYELVTDAGGRGGALTHALLEALAELGPDAPCEALRRQVVARVHGRFASQTPELQGERERDILGEYRPEPRPAAIVLSVEPDGVRVGIGQVHGIRKGAWLAIEAGGGRNADASRVRLEVTELGAVESRARVVEGPDKVQIGASVRVLSRGATQLENGVRIVDDTTGPSGLRARIAPQVETLGEGWLHLVAAGDPADLGVGISRDGVLEILDAAGAPLTVRAEAIVAGTQDAEKRLVRRLVHLAKYRNIRDLRNHDATSPLQGRLAVDFLGWQRDYDPVDPPRPHPFEGPNVARADVGSWVFLRIRNLLIPGRANDPEHILNVTVLDLQPADWGIAQAFPSGAADFAPIEPGKELVIPLRLSLPDGLRGGTDILKVLATTDTTSFRVLELPAMELLESRHRARSSRAAKTELEQLIDAIAITSPRSRHASAAPRPSARWTTAEIELEVVSGRSQDAELARPAPR